MNMTSFQVAALAIVLVSVAWDVTTRRIPNLLTVTATLAAIVSHASMSGWSGAGQSIAGWLVGVALFFPVFALGGMGAGDVKLLGAVGAFLGPAATVWVALFSSIAGGVMALVLAALCGYLARAFTNIWCLLMHWRTAGPRSAPPLTLLTASGPRLAYSVPVLAGLMVTLWVR